MCGIYNMYLLQKITARKNSEIKKNNLRFIFKIPRICTFLNILHTHCDLAWKGGRRMMAKIHEGSKFFKKW